jgi:hypothetical protein
MPSANASSAATPGASLQKRRSLRNRKYNQQQPHGLTVQSGVLTHHDTGRAILSFLDAPALGAVAAVCRPLHTLANTDALWRGLLLAERPHLLSLLQMAGAGGAKAVYRERTSKEGACTTPQHSATNEQTRLRQRLAQTFLHLELYDTVDEKVMGSFLASFTDKTKMEQLLGGKIKFAFAPGARPVADDLFAWRASLNVIDLTARAFCHPLTASHEPGWHDCDGTTTDLFCVESFSGPLSIAPDEECLLSVMFSATYKTGHTIKSLTVELDNFVHGCEVPKLNQWRLLEMVLDNRIKIE